MIAKSRTTPSPTTPKTARKSLLMSTVCCNGSTWILVPAVELAVVVACLLVALGSVETSSAARKPKKKGKVVLTNGSS